MEMERVVADLVQTVSERFYGKYPGSVVDNADPKKLARLKLRIPSVMGEEVSGWAFPCRLAARRSVFAALPAYRNIPAHSRASLD